MKKILIVIAIIGVIALIIRLGSKVNTTTSYRPTQFKLRYDDTVSAEDPTSTLQARYFGDTMELSTVIKQPPQGFLENIGWTDKKVKRERYILNLATNKGQLLSDDGSGIKTAQVVIVPTRDYYSIILFYKGNQRTGRLWPAQ